MSKKKAIFNWSGGKDSALALQKIIEEGEYEVISLLTTINSESQRSSMHAIPVSLLEKQAASIGLPLFQVRLAPGGNMQEYEHAMRQAVEHFKALGADHFIFGDIFLHDVKVYREKQLHPYGITVVEPLWGKTSAEIMQDFIASGLQTIVVTTMADVLGSSFIGRPIDSSFPDSLPEGADVCGENGEYHTFCHAGKIFRHPIAFQLGSPRFVTISVNLDDGTSKDYSYWFADLTDGAES